METPSENLSELDQQIRREFERLGLNTEHFKDEQDAPEVDLAVLAQLAQGELEPPSAELLHNFLIKYESWREAYCRIVADRLVDE